MLRCRGSRGGEGGEDQADHGAQSHLRILGEVLRSALGVLGRRLPSVVSIASHRIAPLRDDTHSVGGLCALALALACMYVNARNDRRIFRVLHELCTHEHVDARLAPTQLRLLPVVDEVRPYCEQIAALASQMGLRVEVDKSGNRLAKLVRSAEQEKVPVTAVVGLRERDTNSLSLRARKVSIPITTSQVQCSESDFTMVQMAGWRIGRWTFAGCQHGTGRMYVCMCIRVINRSS